MKVEEKNNALPHERGKGRRQLSDSSGRTKLTLLGSLATFVAALGILLAMYVPAGAFVTKNSSCIASGCHFTANASAIITTAINGTPATTVSVYPGQTFEVDWKFTNMVYSTTRYDGVNPCIALPATWTIAPGSVNSPSIPGWSTAWDAADGASWNTPFNMSVEMPSSPNAYSINYNGTPWDTGTRHAANDEGTATAADLDRVANTMGVDARITVPANAAPGNYTVVIGGVGHDNANTKANVAQTLTVTVLGVQKQDQTVSFSLGSAVTKTYGDAAFADTATASSTLPVTYSSSNTGVATINSTSGQVTIVGAGTTMITASQTGDATYNPASAAQTLTVNKASQTITFGALSAKTYGDAPFTLSATASSSLPISYTSSNTAVATISGNTVTIVGAGTATITARQAGNTNYLAAADVPQSLTVNQATQTITFGALTAKTYGDAPFTLSATASSGLPVTYTSSNPAVASVSGNTVTVVGAGSTTITATQAGSTNYRAASDVPQGVVVNARPVTVTADPKTKVVGSADPALTYTITSGSLVGSDAFTGALSRDPGETVGLYPIRQNTLALNSNYALAYVGNNLEITAAAKVDQTITFNAPVAQTYGNADFALNATASSGLTVTYVSSNTAVATVTGNMVHIVSAGTANITAKQAGDATYNPAVDVIRQLVVNPKALTITAQAKTKIYGAADPALTYTQAGLVGSDTITGSLTRVAGENVGNYQINQGTVSAGSNYTITYTAANLRIDPKALTINAEAKTKIYGATDPAFTYTQTGLVGSDAITGSLTRVAGENVGNYQINQGTVAAGSNYTITYTAANLRIDPKALTINAEAKTKIYGATDPALTYTQTGLVGSDTISGSLTRLAGENVGNYQINQGTVTAGSNYTIAYTPANLRIDPKVLTINAEAKTKVYGATDPALTYTQSGLVGSDAITGSLTRVAGENVGNYQINQGTVTASSNYTITYTAANLRIDPKSLTINAAAKTKVYGALDPALTYTQSGLVGTDTITGSLTRVVGENVGNYQINQGTVTAGSNYTIAYTPANLRIDPKALTINAEAKTKIYGATDPALTYTQSGLVGSDAITGSLTRVTGEIVGNYQINQGTVTAGSNYTIAYTAANLRIDPKALTITAQAKTKTYGATDPALTYTQNGLVGSDAITGSLTRVVGENVGNYQINQGTVTAGSNYTVAYTPANLRIDPATLTVKANNATRQVGAPDPIFTATITGFVNGDTQAVVSGVPTFSTNATQSSPAGQYTITPAIGTLAASNYNFTFATGSLTVEDVPTFALNVSIVGNGSVYDDKGSISCNGTSGCSASYASGTVVTLTAAGSNSTFAGWSGACTGPGTCTVTMDAIKNVTATFTAAAQNVRVGSKYYDSIQSAYNDALEGSTITVEARDLSFVEELLFSRLVTIVLDGGKDASWNSGSVTTVEGTVTISNGSVTVSGMAIK